MKWNRIWKNGPKSENSLKSPAYILARNSRGHLRATFGQKQRSTRIGRRGGFCKTILSCQWWKIVQTPGTQVVYAKWVNQGKDCILACRASLLHAESRLSARKGSWFLKNRSIFTLMITDNCIDADYEGCLIKFAYFSMFLLFCKM